MSLSSSNGSVRRNAVASSFLGSNGHEYVIGSQLGTGSSGTVFSCSDEEEAVFAVKVVKLHHMKLSMSGEEYEEEKAKLEREVNILRQLSHPNIVKLVDVANGKDCIYVVQELVEGGELFGRITEDSDFRLEGVVKFVFCQLADAVLYLHSKSVIHRDIKPENILVQSCLKVLPPGFAPISLPVYPVIKLVDFGLSKEISSLSNLAQTWVGTPQYWAPEVITAREKGTPYDGRSDIWSMGVLLFVCLCRRYPFSEPKYPGDPSMQDLILKGKFAFPPKSVASENSRDLIRSLIQPDLTKRISIEETFVHPWLIEFPQAELLAVRWPVNQLISIVSEKNTPFLVTEPSTQSEAPPGDIVPFIFPSGHSSVVPNIALAQQSATDQFQLSELAAVQNEIVSCFLKIQTSMLHQWSGAHAVMGAMSTRARELQFVSATTIGKFAVTAELAEAVIEDARLFVQAGAIDASLSCVEEIRTSVAEMMAQCKNVQDRYRSLVDDLDQLIEGGQLVLMDESPQRAITGDLEEEPKAITEDTLIGEEPGLPFKVPPISATLLASSLRDLRRVDEILGKCRFFWSNVEQCLLRLDQSSSARLLANVHLSSTLMERYSVRVLEHKAFWARFKETCTEYAKVSQIEYQKINHLF